MVSIPLDNLGNHADEPGPGRANIDVVALPDDEDLDARFAAIISPLVSTMEWDLSDPDLDAQGDATEDPAAAARADQARQQKLEQEEREQQLRHARREQRRLERAQELAEFNKEKAALEAEYNSADDHFTPPEPPPLPRFRPATIGALVLVALGIALVSYPALLMLSQQVSLVLGVLMIAGGAGLLTRGLRRTDDDPDPGAVL